MGMYGCDGVKGNECFEEKRRKLKSGVVRLPETLWNLNK